MFFLNYSLHTVHLICWLLSKGFYKGRRYGPMPRSKLGKKTKKKQLIFSAYALKQNWATDLYVSAGLNMNTNEEIKYKLLNRIDNEFDSPELIVFNKRIESEWLCSVQENIITIYCLTFSHIDAAYWPHKKTETLVSRCHKMTTIPAYYNLFLT